VNVRLQRDHIARPPGAIAIGDAAWVQSDGRPEGLTWNYDAAELLADGIVHAVGVLFALAGAGVLCAVAFGGTFDCSTASALLYGFSLVAMLGVSAAYNVWPVSPRKWLLRRIDHSAIYILIAATYTPFIVQLKADAVTIGLLLLIWTVAIAGVVLKISCPGRLDRLSIGLYLLLGWSGLVLYGPFTATLPASVLWLMAAGGLLYSGGVIFHVWERLRFQNAIWHGFVLCAAVCHFKAVLDCVILMRA